MPKHSEIRPVRYTAVQMYSLVADVERYPEFLPWCSAARIRSVEKQGDAEVMAVDLVISFKVFRERFGSTVTLRAGQRRIDTKYLDGPFKYLQSTWAFSDTDTGSDVDFSVDFEFRNVMLQKVIGVVFDQAMRRIVRAFEDRAAALFDQ
ncbi:MAG: type II toxin-antitoxin system RatA family toxin [Paracoccaceae bacterium]